MIKTMQNTFVFLSIIVAVVLAADEKLNKLPKSHLILEYNWPEPIKNLRRLPHSESCNHFYLTKPDGKHVLKKCFGDDIFDYRSLRCMEKTYAKCWRDIVKKGHKKVKKQQFLCPYHWGLYPDTEDCSQFYDCLSGKPYPTKCPADTLFDKVERTCVPINEARCAGGQGNMKEIKRQFFCRHHRGLYPDTEDCSLFFDCFNGRPYSRKCPAGSLFDKFRRTCLPSSEARCAGEPDVTKIDNVLFKTSPLTETDRISADSESSTKSGTYFTESTSKEEDISEDVKKPSARQAKPTPVFKIITSHFNEMTTDKRHIITSDNSKFSTPRIASDEDSSEEKGENISEDVTKPSVGHAMLTPVFKIVTSHINEMTTDKKDIITSDNSKFSTPRIVSDEDSSKKKEEDISEDVKKPSVGQAMSTPVFKIITSNFNEMTTEKKHIITSHNSKFSTPRIVSDEDSSEEEEEDISEDVKKSSGQPRTAPLIIDNTSCWHTIPDSSDKHKFIAICDSNGIIKFVTCPPNKVYREMRISSVCENRDLSCVCV